VRLVKQRHSRTVGGFSRCGWRAGQRSSQSDFFVVVIVA
jgi:hypothetical protein